MGAMRTPLSLAGLTMLVCAGCARETVVDGTAEFTFRLGNPANVVHEERPAIVAYERDEGGGTFVTVVDDAGSAPCALFVEKEGEGEDVTIGTECTLATPVGRVGVTLTKGHVPSDYAKALSLEGVLAGGAGTMTLSFTGTPR